MSESSKLPYITTDRCSVGFLLRNDDLYGIAPTTSTPRILLRLHVSLTTKPITMNVAYMPNLELFDAVTNENNVDLTT